MGQTTTVCSPWCNHARHGRMRIKGAGKEEKSNVNVQYLGSKLKYTLQRQCAQEAFSQKYCNAKSKIHDTHRHTYTHTARPHLKIFFSLRSLSRSTFLSLTPCRLPLPFCWCCAAMHKSASSGTTMPKRRRHKTQQFLLLLRP